jgi:hypothetical protein
MAVPSEVRRVQAAIDHHNRKELEWSLWYARMRQSVPSARPADVKYWSAVERQVNENLNPPAPQKAYPIRKKKKENRGLGLSPVSGERGAAAEEDAAAELSASTSRPPAGQDASFAVGRMMKKP